MTQEHKETKESHALTQKDFTVSYKKLIEDNFEATFKSQRKSMVMNNTGVSSKTNPSSINAVAGVMDCIAKEQHEMRKESVRER